MGSISIINHENISIVYNDMSEAKPKDVIDLCMKSKEILSKFPPHTAYVLVNVTNIRFNSQVVQIIKETARDNSPFVKTTAVFGLEGFTKTLVKVVASFSNREMNVVATFEEGMSLLHKKSVEIEEHENSSHY